ncbi:MAG: hypothetical protein ACI3YE_02620 [Candidatus Avispirillum sp.]
MKKLAIIILTAVFAASLCSCSLAGILAKGHPEELNSAQTYIGVSSDFENCGSSIIRNYDSFIPSAERMFYLAYDASFYGGVYVADNNGTRLIESEKDIENGQIYISNLEWQLFNDKLYYSVCEQTYSDTDFQEKWELHMYDYTEDAVSTACSFIGDFVYSWAVTDRYVLYESSTYTEGCEGEPDSVLYCYSIQSGITLKIAERTLCFKAFDDKIIYVADGKLYTYRFDDGRAEMTESFDKNFNSRYDSYYCWFDGDWLIMEQCDEAFAGFYLYNLQSGDLKEYQITDGAGNSILDPVMSENYAFLRLRSGSIDINGTVTSIDTSDVYRMNLQDYTLELFAESDESCNYGIYAVSNDCIYISTYESSLLDTVTKTDISRVKTGEDPIVVYRYTEFFPVK